MPYGNKMQNCTEREHRQKDLRELVWKDRNKKRTGKQVCYQIFSSFFLNVRIVAIYFSIWFEVSRKKWHFLCCGLLQVYCYGRIRVCALRQPLHDFIFSFHICFISGVDVFTLFALKISFSFPIASKRKNNK